MAKRRGRHEGSVYEYDDPVRGPRWIGQIDLGRDQHGKRRRARVYGETREAVSARLIALLHQHRNERERKGVEAWVATLERELSAEDRIIEQRTREERDDE